MPFICNFNALAQTRAALFGWNRLYWLVGGAGSGKTTICRSLSAKYNIPVYDMDMHVYGEYHSRFTQKLHPVNKAWSTAPDGLAWLLDMSWDEFYHFNQAALPEYLSLLVEDLNGMPPNAPILIDGGICNPAILAQVISPRQMVCLATPGKSSADIWNENEERLSMKKVIYQLPKAEETWLKFLEFDRCITLTILKECQENYIAVLSRDAAESVDELTERTAQVLGIEQQDQKRGIPVL